MPDTLRSVVLFIVAAVAEIGGAWLIWQGVREHRGVAFVGAGIVALAGYGDAAAGRQLRADPRRLRRDLRRGFVAWGTLVDGFRPDRFDLVGAVICLLGVAVIIYAPR